jgi:putative PIN family toxin of toxin-antitoxin system
MVKSQGLKLSPSQRKQWLQNLQQSAASSIAADPKSAGYRVVIDTNVWFSALLYGGQPQKVVQTVLARHQLVCSGHIIDELLEHLRMHRPRLAQKWLHALRITLEAYSLPIEATISDDPHLRDTNDEPIIQLVLQTQACLVTGDRDFLDIRDNLPVLVLTTAEAAELF